MGAAVSGSTLFLFAIVNSILLGQSIRASRKHRVQAVRSIDQDAETHQELRQDEQTQDHRFRGIFTRIAYPLFRLVDRPYKLYPIGVLFGLGFDTASSIALLGIAGATNTQVQDTDLGSGDNIVAEQSANRSDASIVMLALLFTAGMTLVDSVDSVLIINAYAPGELLTPAPRDDGKKGAARFEWLKRLRFFEDTTLESGPNPALDSKNEVKESCKESTALTPAAEVPELAKSEEEDMTRPDSSTSTSLSHLLTLLSILLAFAISIITLMGLIGENCDRCVRAAVEQDETQDGGLEGRWWLFWQKANDASGIIGACIVGGFVAILLVWYLGKAISKRYRSRHEAL